MKRLIIKALKILIILAFVSCITSRGIHIIELTTKELPSETELILTTSDPVPYKDTKLENPPCIIISFPENKVFSNAEDELIINKGPIKKIRNEYYHKKDKGQRWLNFIIVELIQDIPYSISDSGSSIIIKIKNPEQSTNTLNMEKTKIKQQLQISDEKPGI